MFLASRSDLQLIPYQSTVMWCLMKYRVVYRLLVMVLEMMVVVIVVILVVVVLVAAAISQFYQKPKLHSSKRLKTAILRQQKQL